MEHIKDFLYKYKEDHPRAVPVASGQLDAFGNVWSCVMWDGDTSEIILMRYEPAQGNVIQSSVTISKHELTSFKQ